MKKILISLLKTPLLIIGYWIFCYELALLCMYGRVNNNIYILLLCTAFLILIIIFTTIKVIKNREYELSKLLNIKGWKYVSVIIIIFITLFYGIKIYKSATNYGGKLAWFIESVKNERSVELERDNIYKYGVEGIFEDINKKYTLSKKLYMSDDFALKFNSDGTITSFDTFLYGKNAAGKEESYLISYNKNKSKNIFVRLNGHVNADYNEDKLVKPLIKTVQAIPVKQTVSKWNENQYGLVYYGKRNWGYNTEGIININKDGKLEKLEEAKSEIIGYTVSIFVPGKEKEIVPARYNLLGDPNWSKESSFKKKKEDLTNDNEQFYFSKEVGYKLHVTDKALGSTFYSLSKTIDGGETWAVINEDPFNEAVGSASGIIFFNEKLGFLRAARPSGTEGGLYRTDDVGITFKKVSYINHEVKLESGQLITPFDFPNMPYEKDGVFNMLVGQGSDGDYNGNSSILYQSKNQGETWEYVKEVKGN
ncbi:glycosyl hydrolase [Bacillus mycoides]|uniref:WD40/YVTN/BNR-like repeat-containing protein n=1 Tax=Bacillus mycoides TaxID=1405 RepID=UPI001C02232A|nr:glycosyl hydrolase [Bacillus mycoides]QWH20387.1 glycosyl hydrolase [Bacillus mycoides]